MNGGTCSNNVGVDLSLEIISNGTVGNQLSISNPPNKKFICKCPPEFEGTQCEVSIKSNQRIFEFNLSLKLPLMVLNYNFFLNKYQWDVNECLISPCLNEGQCFNEIGSFECICQEGFKGNESRINIYNHQIINSYRGKKFLKNNKCNFISGSLCEVEIDDCVNHACQNGASCIDGKSQYTCQCPIGFSYEFSLQIRRYIINF